MIVVGAGWPVPEDTDTMRRGRQEWGQVAGVQAERVNAGGAGDRGYRNYRGRHGVCRHQVEEPAATAEAGSRRDR